MLICEKERSFLNEVIVNRFRIVEKKKKHNLCKRILSEFNEKKGEKSKKVEENNKKKRRNFYGKK